MLSSQQRRRRSRWDVILYARVNIYIYTRAGARKLHLTAVDRRFDYFPLYGLGVRKRKTK